MSTTFISWLDTAVTVGTLQALMVGLFALGTVLLMVGLIARCTGYDVEGPDVVDEWGERYK